MCQFDEAFCAVGDNTDRTKLQRQLASVGQTAIPNGPPKLLSVSKTAEETASWQSGSAVEVTTPTQETSRHANCPGRDLSQLAENACARGRQHDAVCLVPLRTAGKLPATLKRKLLKRVELRFRRLKHPQD